MDKDIHLKAGQIKAARALIDWSQDDLAQASGLSIATIRKIEAGHISPRDHTTSAIAAAFGEKRIVFIGSSGVRLRDNDIIMLEGDNCYLELLRDIDQTINPKKDDVLFMYADPRLATREEIEIMMRTKARGVKWRFLVEEGHSLLSFPVEEYRWLPSKFFKRNLNLIYGNRIAMGIEVDQKRNLTTKIIIVDSAPLAQSLRNPFEFMWENCRKPTFKTAPKDVR